MNMKKVTSFKRKSKLCAIFLLISYLFTSVSITGITPQVQAAETENVRYIYGGFYDDYGYKIIPLGKNLTLGPVMGHYNDSVTNVSWSTTNKNVVGLVSAWDRYCTVKASGEGICTVNGVAESYYALMGDLQYMDNPHKFRVAKTVSSIKLSKNQTVGLGKTKQLKISSTPSSRYSLFASDVKFKSSNTAIATVDRVGNITGKKAGKVTITASASGGLKTSCKVTVKRPVAKKIKINKTSLTLEKGKTKKLKATILPTGAVGKIKWSSSNKKVATVNSKGVVKAKKAGTARITAKISSKIKATCKVTVPKFPQKIILAKTKLTLVKGKTYTLGYKITPKNAYTKLTWSSSNKAVAKVNSKGKITALKSGKANVTVKTSNGKKGVCKVTVKNPVIEPTEKPVESTVPTEPTTDTVVIPTEPTDETEATTDSPESDEITFDISDGWVYINSDNTVTQNDVTTSKAYDKVVITQSNNDPYMSGGINVKSEGDICIVLDGVNTVYGLHILGEIKTTNITLEVKEGTENYLKGGLAQWRKSMTIQGKGTLEIEALGENAVEGSNIIIKDATLILRTDLTDGAVIGSVVGEDCNNIQILEGANVTAYGGCKAVGAGEGGEENDIYIAEGVLSYNPS